MSSKEGRYFQQPRVAPDHGEDEDAWPREDLLEEAIAITTGDRNSAYGDPIQDFRRSANILNAMYSDKLKPGKTFRSHDVAMIVIAIKLSRLQWSPDRRDSWTDIAGYAGCGFECTVREGEELIE